MKNVKPGVILLSLLAATVAAPAAAQDDRGIYLGGSAGYAWYKDSCKEQTIPCGNVDPMARGFFGYRFNRNVQVELGYADLGGVEGGGQGATGSETLVKKVAGFDLSALFSMQVAGDLSAFARLGAYRVRTEQETTASGVLTTAAKTNTAFTYGLGLGYELWRIGLRAEWQRWGAVAGGSATIKQDDIDVLSLGALFRF